MTGGGSGTGGSANSSVVGVPAAVVASTSAAMARRSGTGTAGLPASTCRNTWSMVRSSRSPDLLARRIAWIASAALAGSAASCMLAAVAWTLIIAIECATTSCSSRAIRIRSASTRLRVSSSRACSTRAARSDSAASHWRRAATYAPTAPAASSSGHIVAFGPPNQPNGPSSPSVTKIAAAPASPAATAMRHGRVSATQYTPTMTGTSAAPSIWPSAAHPTAPATASPSTSTGRLLRQISATAGTASSR